ncbi:MAG: hypothetical protein R2806_12365 [Saprospiraceae bacterium]
MNVTSNPCTHKSIKEAAVKFDPLVRLVKPLGFITLNIREVYERPELMEAKAVVMTGLNPRRIRQAATDPAPNETDQRTFLHPVADCSTNQVSKKVVRFIVSFRDYAM